MENNENIKPASKTKIKTEFGMLNTTPVLFLRKIKGGNFFGYIVQVYIRVQYILYTVLCKYETHSTRICTSIYCKIIVRGRPENIENEELNNIQSL